MSDSGAAPYPQVFVVDCQASCVSGATRKKVRWSAVGQKILLILTGLALLGLALQACFIYSLYRKVEAFSRCVPHPFCQNQSSPQSPGQQVASLGLVGPEDHNDVSTGDGQVGQIQKRPFAQLIGSRNLAGENNVVQWEDNVGEASLHRMSYNAGRLLVEVEGHYYLYSKLTFNAAEECSLVQHKVLKVTKAYGDAIELMRSKSTRCTRNRKSSEEDLQNSFLAGIFHLQRGDEVYTTLDDIKKLRIGTTDNIMGAFLIAP